MRVIFDPSQDGGPATLAPQMPAAPPIDARAVQWSNRAQSALFVLTAGNEDPATAGRRRMARRPMQIVASMEASGCGGEIRLYIKDVNSLYLGYVSDRPIGIGTHGTICLTTADGRELEFDGTVGRCREFSQGWYEGFIALDGPERDLDRAA